MPSLAAFQQLAQRYLTAARDPRKVVRDEATGYFGAPLSANTLVPEGKSTINGVST